MKRIRGFETTVDSGSAENFGPDSGLCLSRSLDCADWIINFRSALDGMLVFCPPIISSFIFFLGILKRHKNHFVTSELCIKWAGDRPARLPGSCFSRS